MTALAYYNEFDPHAAQWLRNLISAGHIAPGDVDERSIEDVRPDDLRGYRQCHFFAGVGVWSLALRRIGFPDDARIWTGSCPCQPFSAAGKGNGFADERHLWPAFYHLILQCEPIRVAGEQVASRDGLAWLDTVQTDLEIADYAFRSADTCAAGFGAPHIRQRLYWMADTDSDGQRKRGRDGEYPTGRPRSQLIHGGEAGGVEHTDMPGQYRRAPGGEQPLCNLGDEQISVERPGPTNGLWGDADWLYGRDEFWRAVEPGSFPLADGVANRMGKLRAYGNAITVAQATGFLRAALT